MIPDHEIFLRLITAGVLGALIGLDRERQNQPAGLRTHIILVTGASLAMMLSINLSMQYKALATNGDPTRLAAQVLSGIGFLGAGAILRYGTSIKGLTTATSLWTMAVVGLAVGAGYILVAFGTAAFLLLALTILNRIEKNKLTVNVVRQLWIMSDYYPEIEGKVKDVLVQRTHSFSIQRMERNLRKNRLRITVMLRMNRDENLTPLVERLAKLKGVDGIRVE